MNILVELLLNSNWKLNEIGSGCFSGVSPANARRMCGAFPEFPGASPKWFRRALYGMNILLIWSPNVNWEQHGFGHVWLNAQFG